MSIPKILFILLLLVSTCRGEVITQGGLQAGKTFWGIVEIDTTEPVSFRYCTFHNPGWGIYTIVDGTNILVSDCIFWSAGAFVFRPESFSFIRSAVFATGYDGVIIWGNNTAQATKITVACNDISDAYCAVQIAGIQSDPNVEIYCNRITQTPVYVHTDQISIFESSGTPGHLINIQANLLLMNPDAPQVSGSCGIQAGDFGDSYVQVFQNTVLNGQGGGTGAYYDNGNTDVFEDNIVIGIGYKQAYGVTAGIGVWPGAGVVINNTVGWKRPGRETNNDFVKDFYPGASNGNTVIPKDRITMEYEQELVTEWNIQMVQGNVPIGCGEPPVMIYPSSF